MVGLARNLCLNLKNTLLVLFLVLFDFNIPFVVSFENATLKKYHALLWDCDPSRIFTCNQVNTRLHHKHVSVFNDAVWECTFSLQWRRYSKQTTSETFPTRTKRTAHVSSGQRASLARYQRGRLFKVQCGQEGGQMRGTWTREKAEG